MKVSNEVIAILDAGTCEGNTFAMTGQLDRKTYVAVDKALKAAGGKWNRSAKAHVFNCDAQDAVSDIVLTGKVVDAKREFDFFVTPPPLVKMVMDAAEIRPGDEVLEPSAGSGVLALAAVECGGVVDCIEIQASEVQGLNHTGKMRSVSYGDFMTSTAYPKRFYDVVVMNPPFGRQADIKHVTKALTLLKSNGRLVAIMSSGVLFRENKLTKDFRETIADMDGVFEELPENSFRTSGTNVNTVLLTVAN